MAVKEIETQVKLKPIGIGKIKLQKYFPQLLLLTVLLVLLLIVNTFAENFLTWESIRNILDQSAIYVLLAVGMTFVIGGGGIDLSVGSVMAISAVVMAKCMLGGLPVWLAIILGILVCVGIGIFSGSVIAFLKINPFIVTISMMMLARGFALVLTKGVPIYGFPLSFTFWGNGDVGMVNPPIIMAASLSLLGIFLISQTKWGKYALALGDDEEALRRTGVKIKTYKISIYAFSGFCAALAGMVMSARLNTAEPLGGYLYEMDAIAAVILGGTSMKGGVGSVLGTVIACLTLSVLKYGLIILNVPLYYQQVVTGAIILISIIISEVRVKTKN